MTQDFPDLVRRLIPSVWALELLLLLRRRPKERWSAKALTDELRATDAIVATCTAHYERIGMVARDELGDYRYATESYALDSFCELLASEHRERPAALINLIVAPPDRLPELADAFRLRSA